MEELSLPIFATKMGVGFDAVSLLLAVSLTEGQSALLLLARLGMVFGLAFLQFWRLRWPMTGLVALLADSVFVQVMRIPCSVTLLP